MKVVSLFSGIGGFDKAAIELGMEVVGSYELDKHAVNIYNRCFGTEYKPTDITKIHAKDIPKHDIICAGFPCQSFSIAGKRRGFKDKRGTLFFEIMRIAKHHRTPLLLLENVKGLINHEKGETFKTILKTIAELGYDAEWQVLNSKNFGVPQNRERVFIVAVLRGKSRRKIFPLGENDEETHPKIEIIGHSGSRGQKGYIHDIKGIVGALSATDYKQPKQILQLNNPTHSNNRVYGSDGVSPALNTMQGGNRQPKIVIPVLTPDRPENRQNGRRFKENGEPMFTLTAQDRHGLMLRDGRDNRSCLKSGRITEVGYKGVSIRRLTPKECFRLQGFCPRLPDGSFDDSFYDKAQEVASNTQLYKTAGNAVTVNVVKEIIRSGIYDLAS